MFLLLFKQICCLYDSFVVLLKIIWQDLYYGKMKENWKMEKKENEKKN